MPEEQLDKYMLEKPVQQPLWLPPEYRKEMVLTHQHQENQVSSRIIIYHVIPPKEIHPPITGNSPAPEKFFVNTAIHQFNLLDHAHLINPNIIMIKSKVGYNLDLKEPDIESKQFKDYLLARCRKEEADAVFYKKIPSELSTTLLYHLGVFALNYLRHKIKRPKQDIQSGLEKCLRTEPSRADLN